MKEEHIDFLNEKARMYWKHIAREMNLNEYKIVEIEKSIDLDNKLRAVINIWLNENIRQNENYQGILSSLLNILSACRLNKIKGLPFL